MTDLSSSPPSPAPSSSSPFSTANVDTSVTEASPTPSTSPSSPKASGAVKRPVLTGPAARYLRARGHALQPVLAVGKHGVTDSLVAEAKHALLAHELIKVRVHSEPGEDRHDVALALAQATESALAQVLGRTFLLYKRHPKTPKLQPNARQKAARPAKR